MDEYQEESSEGGGGGFQVAHLASYLAFAKRALLARWRVSALLFVTGVGLSVAALVLLPKTYTCKTVLMALGTPLDRSNNQDKPLTNAEGLIMSHENLDNVIRDTQLVKTFESRRPPLLKLKDRIMGALFTKPDDETKIAQLVGTLETKLDVSVDRDSVLTIKADWSDGKTAAELAETARESFLKSRHAAEISAFEDQMAILDEHASKLRDEINALADQLNTAQQTAAPQPIAQAGAPKPAQVAARPAHPAGLNPDSMLAEDIASMKERLATDKPKLADMENDWQRKLHDEQAKLADLQLRFTPTHPDVITEQQRVAIITQAPPQVAQLRAEVQTLEQDIKGREALAKLTPAAVSAGAAQPTTAEPLPTNVIQALTKDDTDPALRAQLSGAIMKYRELRDDVRSGRIELDTAQAAFNHRYQVIMPAEVPSRPQKPKPAMIIAGGLIASLLLALALPILAELRRGVIVETWQVHHLQLPVLAELQLPPHNDS
ncbi:MAG TPA: hypothetical protein VGM44_04635 [Polyangiaceae bacterium]|jgi:uncharacterized protein involved in exopolysaccharide biosynthesis